MREMLRHSLDQLQVAAPGRPDRNFQRDGTEQDEGDADRGGKQQQAGREQEERSPSCLADAGRMHRLPRSNRLNWTCTCHGNEKSELCAAT